jgi:hypothetical protein
MFSCEQECQRHLALWRALGDNILKDTPPAPDRARSNLWDGDRVSEELLWFFNPNKKYVLPSRCYACRGVIPSDFFLPLRPLELPSNWEVHCPHCACLTRVSLRTAPGNPRNQLFKLHYDGWLAYGIGPRSTRSIASVEVTSATLSKADGGKPKDVFTLCFIPTSSIPSGASENFHSAVFDIIVDEFVDLFVRGVNCK